MKQPLVTVICLCYNQAQFVEEAIQSVRKQTYSNIQLIVIDDASTDNSANVIREILKNFPEVEFISLQKNLGNCSAFNQGLKLAKGDFIIDLAADDVLLPDRVETGVKTLIEKGEHYGVHFSDAEIIDQYGTQLYKHSDRFPHHTIPEHDVYVNVIKRYFICPPTVMFTRKVIDVLGGYDETLTYEDFDFWVRSSRAFMYVYSPEVLVKRRVLNNALGVKQFALLSRHSRSTLSVCRKILRLNNTKEEQAALGKRLLYEIKLNVRLLNLVTAIRFLFLWIKNRQQKYA